MSSPPTGNQKPAEAPAEAPAPRKETFLARYPRKLKIGAIAFLVMLGVLWLVASPSSEQRKAARVSVKTSVSGVDTKEAIANPSPAPVETPQAAPAAAADSAPTPETNDSESVFLTPAPAPGMIEELPQGSLPRVSEDGREAWQVYARPFDLTDKRPRIAIVITDLGLSRVPSDAAINRLPPSVTLAFDAQSPVVGAWCARARQAGHETILQLPMEPFDYPRSDPGPNTLLSNLPNADNLQRLLWALGQAQGYVGVTTLSGSHFTTDPTKITPVLEELHKRGLMIFDAKAAPHSAITDLARDDHIPVAVETVKLDQNPSPAAIDEELARLEQTARLQGRAIGMSASLPIVISRLEPWIRQLRRDGVVLAPITAMVQ